MVVKNPWLKLMLHMLVARCAIILRCSMSCHATLAEVLCKAGRQCSASAAHLIIGRQHAHVERHGPHHGWPCAGEETADALLPHYPASTLQRAVSTACMLDFGIGFCVLRLSPW